MNCARIGVVCGVNDGAPAILTETTLAGLPVLANADLACGLQYIRPALGLTGVTSGYAQGNPLPRAGFPDLDVTTATTATLTFASVAVAALSSTCLLNWRHRIGLPLFAEGLAVGLTDHAVMIDTGKGRHPQPARGDAVWRKDRDFIDALRGGLTTSAHLAPTR